jgi:putative transposase
MPRRPRICPGGTCFHVLNRDVASLQLYEKLDDYEAFERVLLEAHQQFSLPLLAYCLMPNHWHFVVRPSDDEELSAFFRWLTHTHVMRWHAHYHTEGTGHLYQGRFKTFPIEDDDHLYAVLRYVERNPVRANLCERAEEWKYSSAWRMTHGDELSRSLLSEWPPARFNNWRDYVNQPQSEAEVAAIRRSLKRGMPYGGEAWMTQSAVRLELNHTLRSRGRPPKSKPN